MISSTHLYLASSSLVVSCILFVFFIFKPNKTSISNKILLKNLLESLDLELPEELKRLDNSTPDPQKLS
tara:strand:- start:82 stop:288 length:207 start_codon:yes stop_codon:yes gene_type:complete